MSHINIAVMKINPTQIKHGPGTWKMNASVIKSELLSKTFTEVWKDWQKQKENHSMQIWWDLGKKKIKETAIWCASKLKSDRDIRKKYLENCLNKEQIKEEKDIRKLKSLENSLKNIMNEIAEGSRLFVHYTIMSFVYPVHTSDFTANVGKRSRELNSMLL